MADGQRRDPHWRQGQVLESGVAQALGLHDGSETEQTIVVVVSHDCDIANTVDREPFVEVIVGRRIARVGADSHAKNARRLHLEFQSDGGVIAVELEAIAKRSIPKPALFEREPSQKHWLAAQDLNSLQQWLAVRYRRAAFPDEFERRLKDKPAQVTRKLRNAMTPAGHHILAVFFDVDEGENIDRSGTDDLYELRITLLYDSTNNEPEAFAAAQQAAEEIEDEFEKAFFHEGTWQDICLLSCNAISDNAMTVAQSRPLKQWRLDHMSLKDDPQHPMLEQQ